MKKITFSLQLFFFCFIASVAQTTDAIINQNEPINIVFNGNYQ
ncbi:hypothetical protein [Flavobacterium sp. UBA7682]|nr:hypothetical protein [Flavobacterium sp. UBA7682]